MSRGDVIESGMLSGTVAHQSVILLDEETAATPGTWIDVRGWSKATIDITGIEIASVVIHASNAPKIPAPGESGRQVGPVIRANTLVHLQMPVRWLKCEIPSYTSGTISAWMHAES